MSKSRFPALLALAAVSSPALAAPGVTIEDARVEIPKPGAAPLLVVTTRQADPDALTWVTGTVRAGAGKPTEVRFEPTMTRQTGSGAIAWLPTGKGGATLTLTGPDGATLGTYAGSVGADGRLVLVDDSPKALSPAITGFVVASKGGGSTAVVTVEDADAASGVLVIDGVKAEIGFDDVEIAWIADLPPSSAALWSVDLFAEAATSPGRSGRTVWRREDLFKADLPAPWANGGVGVPALAFGDAGQTSFALLPPAADPCGWGASCAEPGAHALVGFSTGWVEDEDLPVAFDLAIAGGGTLRLPLNSAQRVGVGALTFGADPTGRTIEVVTDGASVRLVAGAGPSCGVGKCFAVASDAGAWGLIATVYGADAAKLPDAVKVAFVAGTEKEPRVTPKESTVTVRLSDEVALVFALAVLPAADAWGSPVVFTPSLVGAKELGTLAFGEPAASRTASADLGYALAARTRTGPPASTGDLWAGGEPIALEQLGPDGKPGPVGPPIVLDGNCAGTRSAIPSTRNKPGLR